MKGRWFYVRRQQEPTVNQTRSEVTRLIAALALVGAAWHWPACVEAATRIHNNTINSVEDIHVYGTTNGYGSERKPWVAQFAAAEGDCLKVSTDTGAISYPRKLRAIAADGSVYIHPGNLWIIAPVTGWITVHVDIDGDTERRFKLMYTLLRPGADFCGAGDPPH
jgi:hypothetical protein